MTAVFLPETEYNNLTTKMVENMRRAAVATVADSGDKRLRDAALITKLAGPFLDEDEAKKLLETLAVQTLAECDIWPAYCQEDQDAFLKDADAA